MKAIIARIWPLYLLLSVSGLNAVEPTASRLRLVPFPKDVRFEAGTFALDRPLVLEAPAGQDDCLVRLLEAELQRAGVARPEVRLLTTTDQVVRLLSTVAPADKMTFRDQATEDDYALRIGTDAIEVEGRGAPGLGHGVQTLCQLIRANRDKNRLPCLTIRDWPSLRWRGFQNDMTRGPSAKLETLEDQVSLGAFFKMNLFTCYMEYQYAFKKHPGIGPADGSLQPDELRALVEFGKPLGVDILGNQQSFGHWGEILKKPRYAPLAETPKTLTPMKEESYQLLDDLYSEVCPLVPFPMFNVNCDEVTLGEPSKALADKIGVGGVYARHVTRLHDILRQKYGKRMMIWGDVILKHPENIKDIPKDTIILPWVYRAFDNYENQIKPIADAGYEFMVCPGVADWNWILPNLAIATTNIRNFVRDGAKYGAMGMINTEWKDGAVMNGPNWYGYAWGAECAWNASTTEPADFNRRIGAVLFGEPSDHFGRAIQALGEIHGLFGTAIWQGLQTKLFWEHDFITQEDPKTVSSRAEKVLALVRPAINNLKQCQKEASVNGRLLDALLFGARRIELLATRQLDGLKARQLYAEAGSTSAAQALPLLDQVAALIQQNRDAHEALGPRFSELWLAECKPYFLDRELQRYRKLVAWYDDLLRRVKDAKMQVRAGKPLPPAGAVGLNPPADNT